MALHYLTVQDMLWINLQVAKKVNAFSYAKLEEATFYQYSYGDSKDVPTQAARFLSGFLKLRPFSEWNEASGVIGAIVFLRINGHTFALDDAAGAAWVGSVLDKPEDFSSRVGKAHVHDHGHKPDIRATIETVLRTYPATIAALATAAAA